MVRPRLTPQFRATFLVLVGAVLLSVGAGLVFLPAGLLVAGTACVLSGLFLVNVEGAREPRTTRTHSSTL